ncbi:hypothetical protein EVAR_14954_1 [Eumeta japonica]|uniref:Reverse transcriptase domain-containing protein n=1 Tax=Eumeta variegata TaxID=151549 RepID=A0A4C1XMU2_EUMVA|nr:hypothetical protein EVAR_14954_1 [Eumeta japonica]
MKKKLSEPRVRRLQGGILGPLLVLVCINDIISLSLPQVSSFYYVDDTDVIFTAETWRKYFLNVQRRVAMLSNWLNLNLITLNVSKTTLLSFHKTMASTPNEIPSMKVHICNMYVAQRQIKIVRSR